VNERLHASVFRHDGYTLRQLKQVVEEAVSGLLRCGVLREAGALVVDLGAGDAPYRALFEAYGGRYVACDIEAGPAVEKIIDAAGRVDLPDESADVVVSFQVLEHVWDIDAYLAECRRLLRPGGRLLLSTHGTWPYHPHPTDFRRWTRDGLVREIADRGFTVEGVASVVGPLAWTTQIRWLAFYKVLTSLGWVGRAIAAPLSGLMYLRMLLEDRVTPDEVKDNNAAVYLVMATPKETEA
jgi:SAM-dependent methyltransferase